MMGSLTIALGMKKPEGEEDEAPSGKEGAAADVLKAIEKKSAAALSMALETFFTKCSEEYSEKE